MTSIYSSDAGATVIRTWCEQQLKDWPVSHVRRNVDVHGVDTHVTAAGSGALTVVFLAGTNFNTATSLPFLTSLADDHRVLAVDVPGQPGLSSADRPQYSINWYGAWLDELIATETRDPVVLVGHSFGGAIVLASKASTAGRLVVSTGGLCRLRVTPALLAAFGLWKLAPSDRHSRRLLRHMHSPGREPRRDLIEWMTLVSRHTRSSTAPDRVRSPAPNEHTIAIAGDHDTFLPTPRLAAAVRRELHTTLVELKDTGHLVLDERPSQVATYVMNLVLATTSE